MAPSISVHEGDSYDPYGPRAEDDKKVKVVTDEATEDMSEEDRAETYRGLEGRVLDEAQKNYDEGKGPKVVDLRSEEQKKSADYRDPTELHTTEEDSKDDGEGEQPSPGNSSSTSSETTNDSSGTKSGGDPSTVRSADGPSKQGQAENSTARQETGRKPLRRQGQ